MVADPTTFAQRFPRQVNSNEPYRILLVCNDYNIEVRGWLPEEITLDVAATYEAPFSQGLGGGTMIGDALRMMGVSLTTQALTSQIWQGSSEINFSLPIIFQAESDAYEEVIKPIKDLLKLTMPRDSAVGGGGLFLAPGPRVDLDAFKSKVGELPEQLGVDQDKSTAERVKGWTDAGVDFVDVAAGFMRGVANDTYGTLAKAGATGATKARDAANKSAVAVNTALVNSIVGNISLYVGNFLYFPSVVVTDVSQTYNMQIAPDGNPSRAQVNVTFKMFYIPTQADLDAMFYADQNSSSGASDLGQGFFGGNGGFL